FQIVFDVFELGNFSAFGDIERALVKSQTVGPIQSRSDDLSLTFAVSFDDGVDFVEHAVADKYGSFVAETQGAGVGDAARKDVDSKSIGNLELCGWQLVRCGAEGQGRDVAQLLGNFGVGDVGSSGHGGRLRLQARHRLRCLGSLAGLLAGLLRKNGRREKDGENSGK